MLGKITAIPNLNLYALMKTIKNIYALIKGTEGVFLRIFYCCGARMLSWFGSEYCDSRGCNGCFLPLRHP
jgi:hypothetical protein